MTYDREYSMENLAVDILLGSKAISSFQLMTNDRDWQYG